MDTICAFCWYGFCIPNGKSVNDKMATAVEFEIGKFPGRVMRKEGDMVWMVVSLVLVLCAFFMMCILTLGKRADQRKELLWMDSLDDHRNVNIYAPSRRLTGAAPHKWGSLRPQHNPS
jgi:hypothetical protein